MATAVLRQGVDIDQYKIDDLGGPHDNNLVYISHGLSEVVIQTSSIIYTTSKENLLCWNDGTVLECPDDDLGGGVFRMPVLKQLNDIMVAGGVTVGADLTDLAEKAIFRAFWHEYVLENVIDNLLVELDTLVLNDLQLKRNLRSVYFGNGVDWITAKTIADARIDSGTIATHNDYGLATVSLQYRRMLILFGAVGWFE